MVVIQPFLYFHMTYGLVDLQYSSSIIIIGVSLPHPEIRFSHVFYYHSIIAKYRCSLTTENYCYFLKSLFIKNWLSAISFDASKWFIKKQFSIIPLHCFHRFIIWDGELQRKLALNLPKYNFKTATTVYPEIQMDLWFRQIKLFCRKCFEGLGKF